MLINNEKNMIKHSQQRTQPTSLSQLLNTGKISDNDLGHQMAFLSLFSHVLSPFPQGQIKMEVSSGSCALSQRVATRRDSAVDQYFPLKEYMPLLYKIVPS